MGYKEIILKMPTDYSDKQINHIINKKLKTSSFSYQIISKSLDARNKNNIHWHLKIAVYSESIKSNNQTYESPLKIDYKRRNKKAVIIGSGPAGFFTAYTLQKAGINTIIIERGSDVDTRSKQIIDFEKKQIFNPQGNYAFGEGGAGTFSDGKLTSRSKRISKEKQFILSTYVKAGAPKEIEYLTHPHLGSDNLKIIVKNLRKMFENLGGKIIFETLFTDFSVYKDKYIIETDSNGYKADYLIIAPGHSAFETYKMLINKQIPFRTKNFAIGSRIEHFQEVINVAQWGRKKLKGVKAAEYRLTHQTSNKIPVYTFCMCPGGKIVPATAYENTNIVNGMSNYKRNGIFANSAIVAGVNLQSLLNKELSALDTLIWLENLETEFYELTNKYSAPFCTINDYLKQKNTKNNFETSYPMGITSYPLWEMFPKEIHNAIREGLTSFNKKLKGFDTGNIMGLESKTSAPIQVIREKDSSIMNFKNLFIVGEGSGYAGGIISSAADGIKVAINIIEKNY